MSSKDKYLFGEDADRWQYAEGYENFVTPYQIGAKVLQLANDSYELGKAKLWDMFGGVGTDSILFASKCKHVVSTEINIETHSNLLKNIDEFKVPNITGKHADCSLLASYQLVDKVLDGVNLVYFDPPWESDYVSGQDFDFNTVKLSSGITVPEVLRLVHAKYGYVIVKQPYLCSTFEKEFCPWIIKMIGFPRQKLKFLFLKPNMEMGHES